MIVKQVVAKRFLYLSLFEGMTCSSFAGSAEEYNKLVDEELNAIQSALDGISDDCDDLDYDIAV